MAVTEMEAALRSMMIRVEIWLWLKAGIVEGLWLCVILILAFAGERGNRREEMGKSLRCWVLFKEGSELGGCY